MVNQILFCIAAVVHANYISMPEIQIPRWQPHDFSFQTKTEHKNPFTVTFNAIVKAPDGAELSMPGFYDGGSTWKIRISPTLEGKWSLLTHSDDPLLDGKSVFFICISNKKSHGGLLVDKNNPYHFVFEDGSRYFLMGYECDWLWALDMGNSEVSSLNTFLDKLADYGFNHIILNAYAHDTSWHKGNMGSDDYGPPPMYAWEGSNENPVHSRFNLAYWQHYDRMMDSLYHHEIIAHIMIKVYNKMVNWPVKGSTEDDLFFHWLIARYAAYPNVVWDFSKEANNEKYLEYKLSRFKFLKENDPYRRLITNHDDKATYDSGVYNKILNFRSDQQHNKWHEKILSQREQCVWPVVNVEFGYEHGLKGIDDKTYGVVQSPEEVCRCAWEICMAGGYTAYYYTYTAWDVIRPEDTPPGYAYFKNLRKFFENTKYWLMKPSDELVSEGYCLANQNEYIVFLNQAKRFTLKIDEPSGQFTGKWFNPFTGEYLDAGKITNGIIELEPPSNWDEIPIALHIKF